MEFDMEKKKMLEVYHRSKEQQYAFDKIFREESQEEVDFIFFPYFWIVLDLCPNLPTFNKTRDDWL